ncbi:MAG: hypothetical protein MAG795_00890 [Candidatus Woesearchaeota archaeon]|nr:hypothetical protein [Candidatus Woesearchaeota archaeon]
MRAKHLIWFIVLVLSILSINPVLGISIETEAIKSAIGAGDNALFNITVVNDMKYDDKFSLRFSDDVKWTILTDPLSYKFSKFDLAVGESANFLVKIRASPSAHQSYNQYIIGLTVKGVVTKESETAQLVIGYGPQFLSPKEYAALIVANAQVTQEVDPREDMKITVNLRNRNPLNITNLKIQAFSPLFEKETVTELGPLEEKSVVFTHKFDPGQNPVEDKVSIYISRKNSTLVSLQEIYKIVAYSQLEEQRTTKKSFLKKVYNINYKNNGNSKTSETVAFKTTGIKRLFSKTIPDADVKKTEDGRYLVWNIDLEADEEKTMIVVENYIPLLFIFCVILIAVVLARVLRSPVEVKKGAVIISKKQGGIAGMKVLLKVKNRSKRVVRDVWIVDSVPNIAELGSEQQVGSIEPHRVVKHHKKGTLVKWKVGDLEVGEERIIRYQIKAKLAVVGAFTLPAAVIKCDYAGKKKYTYSNRLRFSV